MNLARLIALAAAAAFLVAPAPSVGASTAGASIQLDVNVAPPLKRMIVQGTGFAPGKQVSIRLDGVPVGSSTVGATGKFKGHFVIPAATPPGLHQVTAVVTGSRQSASAPLKVI
jgi:hypothetical protein